MLEAESAALLVEPSFLTDLFFEEAKDILEGFLRATFL